jgi:hypothetical protein
MIIHDLLGVLAFDSGYSKKAQLEGFINESNSAKDTSLGGTDSLSSSAY